MISVPLLFSVSPLLVYTIDSFGYKFGCFAEFDFEDGLNFMEKSKTPSFLAGYT
jgi:hypothetical protein